MAPDCQRSRTGALHLIPARNICRRPNFLRGGSNAHLVDTFKSGLFQTLQIKNKKPYPIFADFGNPNPLCATHTHALSLSQSLSFWISIWVLSFGRHNGSSDRLRGGVPVFLMRLHQDSPSHAASGFLPHCLKRAPIVWWNGLVRKNCNGSVCCLIYMPMLVLGFQLALFE